MFLICSLFLIFFGLTYGEDNGLARTPPMGWNSWTKFYCNTNCERYPNDCINEDLYKAHADRFVEDGYLAAGYQFVNIDDCWLEMDRDANGLLVANRTRFPNGISGLAQYVHSKGVKLGIYECVGNKTCGGYPGSYGYEEVDAQTFASWGIDYLKYDGCFSNHTTRRTGFTTMSNSLRASGRPIVFSTAWWGADQGNLSAVASISNLQREYDDIVKFWDYGNGSNPRNGSILGIIDHFVSVQDTFVKLPTGPGFWCDPDMIIVGNDPITEDQGRAQMSIWSIWSAPLIMSNDLRNLSAGSKEILLNKYVIAVDQDPLGKFGRMVNQIQSYCYKDDSSGGFSIRGNRLPKREMVYVLKRKPERVKDLAQSNVNIQELPQRDIRTFVVQKLNDETRLSMPTLMHFAYKFKGHTRARGTVPLLLLIGQKIVIPLLILPKIRKNT